MNHDLHDLQSAFGDVVRIGRKLLETAATQDVDEYTRNQAAAALTEAAARFRSIDATRSLVSPVASTLAARVARTAP